MTADPPWLDEDGAIAEWAVTKAVMLFDGMLAAGEGRDAAVMAVLAFAAEQPRSTPDPSERDNDAEITITPKMIEAGYEGLCSHYGAVCDPDGAAKEIFEEAVREIYVAMTLARK